VLGRYLTEFGGIVARTQFNMHHAYTVDEHTLRLVSEADDLMDGRDAAGKLPVASRVAQNLSTEQRLTLMLACLLHDTGKGQGDQCIEGAQLSRRACRRLGMSKEITDTVAWLVRSHLTMSETAQRRDISDPDTVAEFAEIVGSQERLDLLYILTIADIRSVGPGVWNDWKGTLLRGLYGATSDYLKGAPELDRAARAATIAEQVEDKLPAKLADRLAPIFDRLGTSYWLSFDMSDLLRHARFFDAVLDSGEDYGVQTRVDKAHDATELWVLGWDRPGLFADLTRAIATCGGSVAGARLHTGPKGAQGRACIMNVFYLQNADGKAFGAENERTRDTLKRRARQALTEGTDGMIIADPLHSRRVEAIPVRSRVRFIDAPQDGSFIIEVEGRDRPGLLSALAVVLRDAGIDVTSAHIEGIGTKAVDAFYVRSDEAEVFSEAGRKRLKSALATALRGPVKRAA
ncbi:MAG: ACT domain-containing protein, partial [Pseudomonadota bacterium]